MVVNHPNRKRKTASLPAYNHDRDYPLFSAAVTQHFATAKSISPLFQTTAVTGLWDLYLNALPGDRQVHNCNCCRHFITRYGGLVRIMDDGSLVPAIWPSTTTVPDFYKSVVETLASRVSKSKVTNPFLHGSSQLGIPFTDYSAKHGKSWDHLAVAGVPVFRHAIKTPGQEMAAKRESFGDVCRALGDIDKHVLETALSILEANALNRSEKFIAPVKWLFDLQMLRSNTKNYVARHNLTWKAIATAPEGYLHPRSSVTASLFEDIEAGLSFEVVRDRFNAKTHGLRYQRPQAAPKEGAIAVAEKLVADMGIDKSLERRFARLDEIETIWLPRQNDDKPSVTGVFSHLKKKDTRKFVSLGASVITWVKFARDVLPTIEQMDLWVPANGNFMAYLTAVHPDAPPILKWDNSVSNYVYHGGSLASQWRLTPGWVAVTGVAMRPNMWGERPMPQFGEGGVFILKGAVDTYENAGSALFPETLREELHSVRSVIESYSKIAKLAGREEASACGLSFFKGATINLKVQVIKSKEFVKETMTYTIDRWD